MSLQSIRPGSKKPNARHLTSFGRYRTRRSPVRARLAPPQNPLETAGFLFQRSAYPPLIYRPSTKRDREAAGRALPRRKVGRARNSSSPGVVIRRRPRKAGGLIGGHPSVFLAVPRSAAELPLRAPESRPCRLIACGTQGLPVPKRRPREASRRSAAPAGQADHQDARLARGRTESVPHGSAACGTMHPNRLQTMHSCGTRSFPRGVSGVSAPSRRRSQLNRETETWGRTL